MRRGGVASSLAFLASVVVLTVQICINLAFMEVMKEEAMDRAREIIESRGYDQLVLIATNETSLMAINRRDGSVLVKGISLCYPNGSAVNADVEWHIPRTSVSKCQVPQSLRDCVAVILRTEDGHEILLPLHKS